MGIELDEDELRKSAGVLSYNLITIEQGYLHNCPFACIPTIALGSATGGFCFLP